MKAILMLPLLFLLVACGGMNTGCATDLGMAKLRPQLASRAVTWENRTGGVGVGGMAENHLGKGRKGSPCIRNWKRGETKTLMDVPGAGIIRHIWATTNCRRNPAMLRNMILRMYWDGSTVPSVEVPWGDFFACPHGEILQINSALVHTGHAPGRSFNCYFAMPFADGARITLTNAGPRPIKSFYYQIDFDRVASLPTDAGRFHAVFRRQNPTTLKQDFELLQTAQGPGQIVGIVMGLRTSDTKWWGEGEIKCFMDGDGEFPTICGTGLEDYYLTAFGMGEFQTPYAGCPLLLKDEANPLPIVSLYRWHVLDPLRWRHDILVTVQQIGYDRDRPNKLYERQDDYCSVVYYYVPRPEASMPALPDKAARSANLRLLRPRPKQK